MKSSAIKLNDQSFYIRSWGQAGNPALLMLHGFPEFGGAWGDLAPYLDSHFHCIAPDQRGYGQSWAPEGVENYALSRLVSDMVALIETIDAPIIVMGHDWGASVAYGLAMFRPDLVSHLIIANGVHPVPFQRAMAAGGAQSSASQYINQLRAPDAAEHLSADNFAKLERFFRYGMGLDWLSDERMEEYRVEWARPGRLKAMLNWYRASPLLVAEPGNPLTDLPELPVDRLKVTCPHLLIWGEDDKALLPESTEGLEEFAADLTRVSVPNADHWLLHQKPEIVAKTILDWLNAR
ncbi:alpha/beta fold hydrolase [Roseibium sp. RKSG952]|uniref:alpha/beta fold hydrolase n=1 Tax=Roseibium sp. RKSG952 TaxID=2529384 RepID=UPI0012BD6BEA|nr:alpha/beta hydrolase [Roseibium sp. RKSG952]MTI03823.1 alpha/beta hydrolase [Roseibium sp. RKSG952]